MLVKCNVAVSILRTMSERSEQRMDESLPWLMPDSLWGYNTQDKIIYTYCANEFPINKIVFRSSTVFVN